MNAEPLMTAALLGMLEGLTEFLPVSSTGHVLLAGHALGFRSTGRTFEVLIQFGAILALMTVYAARLLQLAWALPSDPEARRFFLAVCLAFLPAAALGVLAHDLIKTVLFEAPTLIACMLILGGVVLLWIDKRPLIPRYSEAMRFPPGLALRIGLFQCLALVPGVSRSGATIVGALLLGADKRSAAEFSFFLSMPTMAGAFAYDLYATHGSLHADDAATIAVGFAAAFVVALVVVRGLLAFIGRRGYALFGWWRIALGSLVLVSVAVN